MTPEFESRISGEVLRDVLWGTSKADVLSKLEVNGFSPERADQLFQKAWKERLQEIRRAAVHKAIAGLALVAAGIGAFSVFWYGFRGLPRWVLIASFAAGVFGGYWVIDGLVEAALAGRKTGPVGGPE